MPSLISLIVFIVSLNKKLILYVAGYDGMVFAYEINTIDGGECPLNSQYLLFNVFLSTNSDQSAASNLGQNAVGKCIN
jgi:hypothetical protein